MSYNSNIPQGTDPILQSQRQILANFQAINNSFATNHVSLTQDPLIAGMHNVLTLRTQTDPATSASEIAIYNKLVASVPEIFFRPSSSQTPIQLTYPSIKSDLSVTQYTFIAGPFVVYGGLVTNPSQGQTITLTPTTTLLYVDLTVANAGLTSNIITAIPKDITGSSFNINYQTGAVGPFDVYYFAIGK